MSNVIVEKRAKVGHLALNRTHALNALNREFIREIDAVLEEFDRSPGVHAILITSRLRHFCAGADIQEMIGMNIEEVRSTAFVGCLEQLSKVSKPVVVAINGLAAGGGCELVEMCDIVIAGQSAKFSHPEITLAAMPGAGGTQRLSRVVGKHIAMDMLLTGRPLSAQEALIAGLVSRVVPDEELVSTAWQIAEKVAAFSNPVARRIKACVTQTQIGLDRGLVMERDSFHRCFEEHDFKEGLDAFLNRREPQFLHQ